VVITGAAVVIGAAEVIGPAVVVVIIEVVVVVEEKAVGALVETTVDVDGEAVVELVDSGVVAVTIVSPSPIALSLGSPHADASSAAPITVAHRRLWSATSVGIMLTRVWPGVVGTRRLRHPEGPA
jgi:hypothetical protein